MSFNINNQEVSICGCGINDTDTDGYGMADCKDLCPMDRSSPILECVVAPWEILIVMPMAPWTVKSSVPMMAQGWNVVCADAMSLTQIQMEMACWIAKNPKTAAPMRVTSIMLDTMDVEWQIPIVIAMEQPIASMNVAMTKIVLGVCNCGAPDKDAHERWFGRLQRHLLRRSTQDRV